MKKKKAKKTLLLKVITLIAIKDLSAEVMDGTRCIHMFMRHPNAYYSTLMKLFEPGLSRFWFGARLMYLVSEPKYFQIILPVCLTKDPKYEIAKVIIGEGLLLAPDEKWKRNRKLLAPTFQQKILDRFVGIFSRKNEILLEQLKQYSGKGEFDVYPAISRCTLDTICATTMGVEVNAQTTDAAYPKWVERMLSILLLKAVFTSGHIAPLFNLLPLGRECVEIAEKMHDFSGKIVKQKKIAFEEKMRKRRIAPDEDSDEESTKKKIFLDYLLEIVHEEKTDFTEKQLRHEVDAFMIAGTDLTATTNGFTMLMLGIHQDMQDKMYDEIMGVLGPDRDIEPSDLPQLKYTERFIKETLRFFPTVPFLLRAIVEDIDVGDRVLVAGTSVAFCVPKVHMNEEYWPNPTKFDPDRFLPEEAEKRHPCAYLPFSYGPRNCIGLKYALMVMQSLIATVVRKYRISTPHQNIEDIELKFNLLLKPKNGFKISLQLRSDG
ncbi:hypothetical protein JTB14_018587 [Gonioctena quinquepunctata]|nr:hypothetical protein JTB14_018587 [Gonioctena quinquepunctata]